MRTARFPRLAAFAALLFLDVLPVSAGESPAPPPAVPESPFRKGATELQFVAGPFFHVHPTGGPRPRTDYYQAALRYGWMLTKPRGTGLLRGNVELLLEGFGAGTIDGPRGYLAGGDFMFRYNFLQPEARLVPYFQTVTGGLYNDVHRDDSQGLIDTAGEFYLGADLGLRWMLTGSSALTGEVGYRHISNANAGGRNFGLNSLGATFGVSFLF